MWKGHGEISGDYWGQVKKHAENKKREMSVSIEAAWQKYLEQGRKCALSGLPLTFERHSKKRTKGQTASLDRIDSRFGYTDGNVQWVHKIVQKMKTDLPQDVFIEYCAAVAKEAKSGR